MASSVVTALPRGEEPLLSTNMRLPQVTSSSPDEPREYTRHFGGTESPASTRLHLISGLSLKKSSGLSKSAVSAPKTPVFIPPLTPRRHQDAPSNAGELEMNHKRTASRANLQQERTEAEARRVVRDHLRESPGTFEAKRRRLDQHVSAIVAPARHTLSDPPVSLSRQERTETQPGQHTVARSLDLKRGQASLTEARRNHLHASTGEDATSMDAIAAGVAARRGPAARSRNLNIQVKEHNENQSGAHSAPIRPTGFEFPSALPEPAPPTAWPSTTAGNERCHHHSRAHHASFAEEPPTVRHGQYPIPAHLPASATTKSAFLSLFESFYDSLADSRVLSLNLDEQVRRSSSLLAILERDSTLLERTLDRRLDEMGRNLTKEMMLLEGRLERIEQRLGLGPAILGKTIQMPERLTRVEHATSNVREAT